MLCFAYRIGYFLCSGEINHEHVHSAGFSKKGVVQFVLSLNDMHVAWQIHTLAGGFGACSPIIFLGMVQFGAFWSKF